MLNYEQYLHRELFNRPQLVVWKHITSHVYVHMTGGYCHLCETTILSDDNCLGRTKDTASRIVRKMIGEGTDITVLNKKQSCPRPLTHYSLLSWMPF